MRNVSDKLYRENQKTHVQYFFSENRAVYEIMLENIVQPGRPQITIRHMRTACWIPEATNTLLEYVILIAFPLQQWLHECASMLRYTRAVHKETELFF